METKNIQRTLDEAFKNRDIWKVMRILHHAKSGLLDYICNNLYHFPDRDIQAFLPQLCTRVLKDPDAKSLERFVMDRCSSLNLAIQMFFWFQAAEEDGSFPKQRSNHLWHECEMAAVNSKSRSALRIADYARTLGSSAMIPISSSATNSPQNSRMTNSAPIRYSASLNDLRSKEASHFPSSNESSNVASPEAPSSPEQIESSQSVTNDVNEANQNIVKESKMEIQPVGEPITATSLVIQTGASNVVLVPTIEIQSSEPVIRVRSPSVGSRPLQITSNVSPDGLVETVVAESIPVRPTRSHARSPSMYESSPRNRNPVLSNRVNQVKLDVPPSPSKVRIELLDADNINSKKSRHYFFQAELHFLALLTQISTQLKRYGFRTKAETNAACVSLLKQLQDSLSAEKKLATEFYANRGLYLPVSLHSDTYYRVVRILPEEALCMSSKDRVPYMLFVETIRIFPSDIGKKDCDSEPPSPKMPHEDTGLVQALEKMINLNRETKINELKKQENEKPRAMSFDEEWVMLGRAEKDGPLSLAFPELWVNKEKRLRDQSPYGHDPNWKLQSVIVKSGDDLRQEQLAVQLIATFHQIFKDAELHLWLRPYSVIATSSMTGLIETIPDAISLDALKKRIPNMTSLDDYFVFVYGEKTSITFIQAQRNFVESLAGYSLVCYLLQIKDRHNGNILIDKEGHIIHIDYGFMLSSSPGSLNFETAPFKLTNEFIQLMGGEHSDMFHYFRLMFIRGFLELRANWEKIVLLVEMLLPGQRMNCFARKEATVKELKDRFQLGISEKESVVFVHNLIRESMGRWTTNAYDNYQWFMNGILS